MKTLEQRRMTADEWRVEGERRFGADPLKWKFVCPSCGHIQAVEDFRPYKAQGATADSAFQQCIGRFTGAGGAFDATKWKPCNYAIYGLFHLQHVVVIHENGSEVKAFSFADAEAQS